MRIAAGAATDAEHLPSGSTTGAKRREKGRGGAASAKHLPEAANPRGDANLKAANHGGFFVGASRSEVRPERSDSRSPRRGLWRPQAGTDEAQPRSRSDAAERHQSPPVRPKPRAKADGDANLLRIS